VAHAVIVTLTAKDGRRDELLAALEPVRAFAQTEPGTLVYAAHTSERDPNKVWMYEVYTDVEAFRAHGGSEVMRTHGPALEGLLAEPQVIVRCDVGPSFGLPVS
jgi:quinol monooxygenase YgiN